MGPKVLSIISGLTQSTTKSLSTSFTLVNLGDGPASGTVEYYLPDGSPWSDGSEEFTLTDPGGQVIFRQYNASGYPGNPNLTDVVRARWPSVPPSR